MPNKSSILASESNRLSFLSGCLSFGSQMRFDTAAAPCIPIKIVAAVEANFAPALFKYFDVSQYYYVEAASLVGIAAFINWKTPSLLLARLVCASFPIMPTVTPPTIGAAESASISPSSYLSFSGFLIF